MHGSARRKCRVNRLECPGSEAPIRKFDNEILTPDPSRTNHFETPITQPLPDSRIRKIPTSSNYHRRALLFRKT